MNRHTESFALVAITPPVTVVGEHESATLLLKEVFDILHVRKPDYSEQEMRNYLTPFCAAGIASRIVLHSHFNLANELGLKGIHINERAKQTAEAWQQYTCVSVAIHQLSELHAPAYPDVEYALLSPFFPSISKEGYCPRFSLSEIQNAISATSYRIVALGGLTPARIPLLRQMGCYGAAFLGYLWQRSSATDWKKLIDEFRYYKDE